jgi:hypothetical protein
MERFDVKTDSKVLNALLEFKDYEPEGYEEADALKLEKVFFMDDSQVVLIEALSERAKRTAYKFMPAQKITFPQVCLDFFKVPVQQGGYYSAEFLRKIIKLFEAAGSRSIKTSTKLDSPAVFESDDFRVILAPKMAPKMER